MGLLTIISIPIIAISTYRYGGALFFYAVGISSTGPVAGGLFASAQGVGLVAGSIMSRIQSAAMIFK
jgi:hypothetical protein